MTKITGLQNGFQKIIQNLFVMKSETLLKAKGKRPDYESSHAESKAALWKKISLFGAFPTVGLVAAKIFSDIKNEGEKERPPFVAYSYLRLRGKKYPWADGNRTFFHNPHVNPLPNGYED